MPARFDTTENALVTSRALCWLVAFADFFSENLKFVCSSLFGFHYVFGLSLNTCVTDLHYKLNITGKLSNQVYK